MHAAHELSVLTSVIGRVPAYGLALSEAIFFGRPVQDVIIEGCAVLRVEEPGLTTRRPLVELRMAAIVFRRAGTDIA